MKKYQFKTKNGKTVTLSQEELTLGQHLDLVPLVLGADAGLLSEGLSDPKKNYFSPGQKRKNLPGAAHYPAHQCHRRNAGANAGPPGVGGLGGFFIIQSRSAKRLDEFIERNDLLLDSGRDNDEVKLTTERIIYYLCDGDFSRRPQALQTTFTEAIQWLYLRIDQNNRMYSE